MNNKEKLETAILLLKMAREQLDLKFSDFNQTRFKDEIKEARRLQADVLRGLSYSDHSVFRELKSNDRS
ncbi:hypothetical protein JEM48_03525 [Ligilactobacillus salivarius]|uniref:hypothetical protein n=1 Tax=Ligilactobacillus salivarius TaxID=1624 RepID=UPI00191DB00C|nr:hypothetical protein [Ligilactobacillus salivarius]MBL1057737.1 hypothetical protein [Ligilactobacillus salivarius]